MKQVGFGYGILCDDLEVQASEQGYTLGESVDVLEKRREAIAVLLFGGILTDSQVDKAYQKLNNQVTKSLKLLESEVN